MCDVATEVSPLDPTKASAENLLRAYLQGKMKEVLQSRWAYLLGKYQVYLVGPDATNVPLGRISQHPQQGE